jgi:dTDP-3-amino-3,4,6-trideoxy-alpha-D-glucose transaminase
VIVVHLFGNIAPVAEIAALGVPVLEDAAQSAGSRSAAGRPGSLGTAATFSFFPSKNLGCFGDGGAILTSDAGVAERARMLRFHGSHDKVTYEEVGYNSRLDELQAALLRVELPHLDAWADGRRAAGAHYERAGLGELVKLPRPVAGAEPAWHLYVIAHPDAPALEGAFAAAGIGHKPYYRTPIHLQPAMRAWGAGAKLPATDEAARTHLAIPMSPVLTPARVEEVVAAVRGVA